MRHYLMRRLFQAIPLLIGISMITFLVVHLAPGDPTVIFIDPNVSVDEMRARRQALGLDDPLPVQYWRWISQLAAGDFGTSFADGRPVMARIMERMPATLELGILSLAAALAIAVPLGIISAVRQYSAADYFVTVFGFAGLSIPNFVFGLLLILLFTVELGWMPLMGRTPSLGEPTLLVRAHHLILPVATLALSSTAGLMRFMRSSMLEVIRQDYTRTARSKGLSERVVIYRHGLRNALIPIITILGLSLPGIITGAVLTEAVFAWPGLGRLAVQSVFNRDFPTIMGLNMVVALLVILANLLADVLYVVVDPRIRYQ